MAPNNTGEEASLKDLDRQLEDAVNYCTNSGLTPIQISECAEPIISWLNKKRRQRTLRRLLKLSLVVVIIAFLWENESCFRWVCIGCKLLQLKLLPYWDWTNLYDISCVISNPYYKGDTITAEDCKWCQEYRDVHRLKNLSHDVVTHDYLLKNLPVIVTDAAASEGPSAADKLSFKELSQMYLEDEVYKACLSCHFVSSVDGSSMSDFLASISDYGTFNAHWFNCEFNCMKAFRKFYQRPYFIPPMVGSSVENVVIVGQKSGKDKESLYTAQSVMVGDPVAWVTQIKGQFHVTLNSECGCRSIEEILQEGETLAYSSKAWWFTYHAVGEGEVIALGSSGNWD